MHALTDFVTAKERQQQNMCFLTKLCIADSAAAAAATATVRIMMGSNYILLWGGRATKTLCAYVMNCEPSSNCSGDNWFNYFVQ